ncbi:MULTISPECIES: bifunctional 4-hydroxy-3-methylbut-2-enyl diphosphate reductase/30S ribosomal protein S1 [Clostridium]|jgi:4-hydroxy-3-methylbut-2-enyl diphosphate reductase|uniref:bifunctional 4-hydroxy-3-methylbut-2-enyl diphosphate reductase/30S ribosomal protein S1 n=1 Tax=Clostridium TaxID=1485 RepID=UPI00028A3A3C|nr:MULTISPECIES: bifunctional 4-hydroxy-3-methylbut-2-enyl diphosphate reductase/30S ribosomal protein S1 [Clostridium]MDF2502892.1 (E)-4-hydroxy-3-methyl-but-2-enyl pyrophosphate reductase [Clostridium sp.]
MKKIILAKSAGFCFGVKRAVDIAISIEKEKKNKIYTLGQLIHNNDVVKYLKDNNIHAIDIKDVDLLNKTDTIIIRSHGVSPDIIKLLEEKELSIVNATCPFVSKIHEKVKKYSEDGYKIVIVGDKEHPEIIGINGWCGNKAIISKFGENLDDVYGKICLVAQTTEKQENWEKVLSILLKKSKDIVTFNTICSATERRQKKAEELAKISDAMVVIGGHHSSNTTKLYEICKSNCENTIHVENSGEIPDELYKGKDNIRIGVAAGASTPDWIIKEAMNKMSDEQNVEGMNEVIRMMDENEKKVYVGALVKGEIIQISEKEAFLNIGYKNDGILPLSEVTRDQSVKLTDLFTVGQEIETKVIKLKNEDNYVVLSRSELERDEGLNAVKEAFENKSSIKVTIKESVNGGLVSRYKGVRVFIPASHIELYHVDDLDVYKGKEIEINIIEFSKRRNTTRIVGSRRELLKSIKQKEEEKTWESLEKDQIVEGEVKRLTNFGAFIDVNGVDGLLHVSEISWGRIEKPSDVLKVNEKVKVYILDVDKENKKLSLSLKKLVEDPWTNVEEKYPVGSVVLGKVVRFATFGAFIELEPGVDALVHISEISHKRIAKPSDVLNIGEEVKAKILDVNKEDKKIGLSIKEVEETVD